MNLRPYQLRGEQLLKQSFSEGHKAVIGCMPTGSGKTVLFSTIASKTNANGKHVLILCDRKELIAQAKDKLKKSGLAPMLIIPGYRGQPSNLYLASVDTLRNRPLPLVHVVIVDEAHKKTFDEIVLKYKKQGALVIGFTATPTRKGKKSLEDFPEYTGQLADIYTDIVEPVTITELIRDEYLVPAITYGAELDLSDVKMKGDDFDAQALYERFNKSKLYGGVVDNYLKLANGTKAIVYNINVEHSKKMTEEFNARGISSRHVDGKTPIAEREKIFKAFNRGDFLVLNNCDVATTGYDEPTIETVIVNRPTMSLTLWLQMAGRGGRPCPEINKTHFKLIDQGGNVFRHGFWQDERVWTLDSKRVSKSAGVAPMRECEQCQALIPAMVLTCPYCGLIKEKQEQEAGLLEGEFVVLDKKSLPAALKKPLEQMTVEELEQYRAFKEYSVGWIVRQLVYRGEKDLREYGRMKRYANAWATKQLDLIQENQKASKKKIWAFMQDNKHVDVEFFKNYAEKKLRQTHSPQQIETLMPEILRWFEGIKSGQVTIT